MNVSDEELDLWQGSPQVRFSLMCRGMVALMTKLHEDDLLREPMVFL